ncbi:hypothetical protein BD779DRAFT_1073374 [Infundibulicybe gibba]|nr:hypothetical protein BD779DRAFT_1073374 [Infundibulicybe gibba]
MASDLLGPIFLGVILNCCLVSFLTIQVYTYYVSNKQDRTGLKLMVCFLFLADIAQTGIAITYSWNALVVSSVREFDLNDSDSRAINQTLLILNCVVTTVVQIFFSWRIWFLNTTIAVRTLAASIGVIALLQPLLFILLPNLFPGIIGLFTPNSLVVIAWLSCNFVSDVFITSSMLYILRKAKRQSLSRGTETMISRLMVNTVQTGAVTAVAAGIGLGLGLTLDPIANYYATIMFILPQLFSNVCLANLNMRAQTRRLGGDVQFLSTAHSGVGRENSTLRFAVQATSLARSQVDPEGSAEMGVTMSSAGFEDPTVHSANAK